MLKQYINIVIPLSRGSKHHNWELRMALRSIERYSSFCGKIFVMTDEPPDWLQNVEIIPQRDRHQHNKDANIIEKLLAAACRDDLSRNFIFWSDDQLALQPFDCRKLQPVFNRRRKEDFSSDSIWHRRICHTFEYLEKQGKKLYWNWESHTPQILNKHLFKKIFSSTKDYLEPPGFGINTFYYGSLDTPPLLIQEKVKFTLEKSINIRYLPTDKLFLGYNDAALQGDLKELLQKHFTRRSRFESY